MKITDYFNGTIPTLESKYIFACLTSPNDIHYDFATGYKDGVETCLQDGFAIDDVKKVLKKTQSVDSYDDGFCQAMKDFLKEKGETNERI